MKILVTGHRGYLGTALVAEMLHAGHDLSGLDADLYAAIAPLSNLPSDVPKRHDIPWTTKDIRDVEHRDFEGFDAVVHLAGLSNDPLGALDPKITFQINQHAAIRCAQTAKFAGVRRFIFASSCSVYGASDDSLLTETSSFAPVTAYAESKARAEQAIAGLGDSTFAPVNLRSGTIYGATAMTRFDLVANNLTAWALDSGDIRLKSDGTAWRPIVHVCDVARAFRKVLEAPEDLIRGQAFNVADSSWNMQILDVAKAIEDAMPGCSITFSKEADADTRNYKVDGSKLNSLLGDAWWTHEFETALPRLIKVLRPMSIPEKDFEGPAYQRVAHLNQRLSDGTLNSSLRQTELSYLP